MAKEYNLRSRIEQAALAVLILVEIVLGTLVCLPITHPPLRTFLEFFTIPSAVTIAYCYFARDEKRRVICRYAWLIFYFTLMIGYHLLDSLLSRGWNFIPFMTIRFYLRAISNGAIPGYIVLENLLFGMVQFLPLCIFVWFFGKWRYNWKANLLIVLVCAAVFEILQWLTGRGVADVDDILMAAVGCGVVLTVFHHIQKQ